MANRSWQETAKIAQDLRDASISRVEPPVPDVPSALPKNVTDIPEQLLTKDEVLITRSLAENLLPAIASGKLTSVSVTNAFLRRASLAQKLTNCITELLPEDALSRAKYLDSYYAKHKCPIGPLHGLPISVKEHIGMKGKGLNAGFVSWWDRKAEDDAHVLKILWKAGCVFYARTTEPQTLMHLETSNNLYGTTVNPFNRDLTPGGSSGGEGALLGLRGSCLGIGSDIGGSVRSPAANCGLYSLKPTSYRIPTHGWAGTMYGEEQIVPVTGPMSTSLEGVKLFMKTVLAAKPWMTEPALLPIPWRDHINHLPTTPQGHKKLKIAVLWHDGVVRPHPPITRALRSIVQKLKSFPEIFTFVDWHPYNHAEAWEIISTLYFPDGGREEIEAIEASGEPWRPLSEFIIKENPHVKRLSVEEVWYWTARREAYRMAYAKRWNETATPTAAASPGDGEVAEEGIVDVILAPVGPSAAPRLGQSKYWAYTAQWNLLDYPALVFPVTHADPKIDKKEEGYVPLSEKDGFNEALYGDHPEVWAGGVPVGLQLVGRRYEDEKLVEALELVRERVGMPF
ncbi:MAG: hypothetical protein LQ350_003973 [Teloschistes chrysophthalmus]|nr:MAG: hypothetical protein LQ350_003973 [Niorma chrysophthalma]